MTHYPNNSFTQLIERAAEANRTMGASGGGLASAGPLPTAQSASLGREVPDEAPPLSPEEREVLDRMAIAAGIRDPRITVPEETEDQYGSLEDAIAAGAPVEKPAAVHAPDRSTAREFTGGAMMKQPTRQIVPRLPDFQKVEGIDLTADRVILDGMDFPITAEKSTELKRFVVEVARQAIMERLNDAMSILATANTPEDTNGGSTTESSVPAVQLIDEGNREESSQ